jgi:hypothetical protein
MPLQRGLTSFVKAESPCYNDSLQGNRVLFPFTYSEGVLDITYEGNSFEAAMVTITGNAPNSETDTALRILGTPRLVTSLGENFKAYIRAWRTVTIDAGSPIEIYIAPQVIRVQELDRVHIDADVPFQISTIPPSGGEYIAGSEANLYLTKYVFKTPLTFTIVEGGVTQYITFNTALDQE